MGVKRLDRLALCAAVGLSVQAQIRIVTPDSLQKHFASTGGMINGGTAVFGAPYFGEHVLGQLRGVPHRGNHCADADYNFPSLQGTVATHGERVHDIYVLEHNARCTACKKVRIAQAKGASAVILVDPSLDSEKQVQEKILGDDGWGQEVKIPSILVSGATGRMLFAAMRQETVIVELRWDIPQSEVVSVDFWWSSGAREAQEFLQRFKESAEILQNRMQFMPHYFIFDLGSSISGEMGDLCTDVKWEDGVRHCAPDPDGPGPITGADVANEDVRQLCLWHKTAVRPDSVKDGWYSEAWWNYVSSIYDSCPLEEPTRELRFGSKSCSYKLMAELNVDTNIIDGCVQHHSEQYLEESARQGAWSEQALRINGWRYRGSLDPEVVLKAICAGFSTPTAACEELLNGWFRKSLMILQHRVVKGLTKNTFVWLMVCICILSVLNCFLYRRYIIKIVKRQMREEVMIEVQSQMTEYSKLRNGR